MADIVGKLRDRIAGNTSRGFILMSRRDLIEAADEIERLREALSAERARTLAAASLPTIADPVKEGGR